MTLKGQFQRFCRSCNTALQPSMSLLYKGDTRVAPPS